MLTDERVQELFRAIDAMDAEGFASFFTGEGRFVYGAQIDVSGRDAVREGVAGFFGMLKSLSHSNLQVWPSADGSRQFIYGEVHYVMPNGNTADIAFLNLFAFEGELISDYRVFTDPTPMFKAME